MLFENESIHAMPWIHVQFMLSPHQSLPSPGRSKYLESVLDALELELKTAQGLIRRGTTRYQGTAPLPHVLTTARYSHLHAPQRSMKYAGANAMGGILC
jgi:hypothetical protein